MDWIKDILLEEEENIDSEDLDLIKIVDSPEEAVRQIDEFYNKYHLKPNF